jgi:hypothetical protein
LTASDCVGQRGVVQPVVYGLQVWKNSSAAAEQFIGIKKGDFRRRGSSGCHIPSNEELQRHVGKSVDRFLAVRHPGRATQTGEHPRSHPGNP